MPGAIKREEQWRDADLNATDKDFRLAIHKIQFADVGLFETIARIETRIFISLDINSRGGDKGMQSGGSFAQRLTILSSGRFRPLQRISCSVLWQGGTASSQVRPINSSSTKVPSQDRIQNSNSSAMGDLIRPLKQILPGLQEVVPALVADRHKGQAGKIGVIGGCREYTGAPYYAAISALKLGADLSHVFCTEGAGTVIKSYNPELIVHPVLRESHDTSTESSSWQPLVEKVVMDVVKWIPRFDCLVIGPGLGRDDLLLETVAEIIHIAREKNIPMVIDGDGLFLVTNRPELVTGYPLAILTPNVNEHKRLVNKMMGESKGLPEDLPSQLRLLAEKMSGVTIVQKGKQDLISDGQTVLGSEYFGSPRRCGGQGDVLSGIIAVFMAWSRQYMHNTNGKNLTVSENISSNPGMVAALAGSLLVRKAAAEAFAKHKRSTLTTDIIESLGPSMEEFFPVQI